MIRSALRGAAVLVLAGLTVPFVHAADLAVTVRDASGQPVPDAVVFVYEVSGATFTPPAEPAILDQIGKEYVPHILPILAGTRVKFPNRDNIHHHVYSFSPAKTFELPLYKGEPAQPVTFDKVGVVKLGCNIHDWMSATVLVLDNPYFALTSTAGACALTGLPERTLSVAAWHERLTGPVESTRQDVRLAPGAAAQAVFTLNLRPAPPKRRPAVGYP